MVGGCSCLKVLRGREGVGGGSEEVEIGAGRAGRRLEGLGAPAGCPGCRGVYSRARRSAASPHAEGVRVLPLPGLPSSVRASPASVGVQEAVWGSPTLLF